MPVVMHKNATHDFSILSHKRILIIDGMNTLGMYLSNILSVSGADVILLRLTTLTGNLSYIQQAESKRNSLGEFIKLNKSVNVLTGNGYDLKFLSTAFSNVTAVINLSFLDLENYSPYDLSQNKILKLITSI